MKRFLLTIISLALMATVADAQIISVDAPASARKYSKTEFTVSLKGKWENPYLQEQVALDMALTSPSGKTLVLPCYYESGKSGEPSEWKARFTAQETGIYSYTFRLSECGGIVSESAPASLNVKPGKGHGILHTNDNWTLRHDDGTLFRGIAENICWESRDNDDSKFFSKLHEQADRFNYDVMLPDFAANGGNFVRVWMCSWNFPIDRQRAFNNSRYTETTGYMNASAVKRLDDVITLAESLDIKFMLCMGAGDVATDRNFFVSEEAKTRFRNRLRYIVARWGYSPAIGMWEFFNEIDNIQFRDKNNPIPAEDIVGWHTEMAKYLKSIDPFGHITTTSISHRDLAGLNSVPDLDINQKHIYNATSVIPGTISDYEARFGKPYVIGEFGREWDWSKNFDDFADEMDADFRRGLWYGIFSPTPVTPMSWWWEYFENRNMVPYFKAVRKVSDMMLAESGGKFETVEAVCDGGEAFALKCGRNTYVYVYNPSDKPVTSVTVKSDKRNVSDFDFASHDFTPIKSDRTLENVIIPCSIPRLGEALYVIK